MKELAVAVKIEEGKKNKSRPLSSFIYAPRKPEDNDARSRGHNDRLRSWKWRGNNKETQRIASVEEDPVWKMLENPKHWGIKDASKNIDEFVYGCWIRWEFLLIKGFL